MVIGWICPRDLFETSWGKQITMLTTVPCRGLAVTVLTLIFPGFSPKYSTPIYQTSGRQPVAVLLHPSVRGQSCLARGVWAPTSGQPPLGPDAGRTRCIMGYRALSWRKKQADNVLGHGLCATSARKRMPGARPWRYFCSKSKFVTHAVARMNWPLPKTTCVRGRLGPNQYPHGQPRSQGRAGSFGGTNKNAASL